MKTTLVLLVVLLLGPVSADVGVAVEFPDGSTFTKCVEIADGKSAYHVMAQSGLDLLWSNSGAFGHMLCKINDIGDDLNPTTGGTTCLYDGSYWGFQLILGGASSWSYSPVGFDFGDCWNRDFSSFEGHYCSQHGDVLGFSYGAFGVQPDFISFSEICSPQEESGKKSHKIEITEIEPRNPLVAAGESLRLSITIENKGKEDELIRLGSSLPDGCRLENETEINLTRRMKEISLDLDLMVARNAETGRHVSSLIAESGYDEDRKTFILEILPPTRESKQVPEPGENTLQVALPSENSVSEAEPELRRILYDYAPKVLESLYDPLIIHLYYLEDETAIDLADTEVNINKLIKKTDDKGLIRLEPTPGQDTLLEVEMGGFEDLKVIFRIPLAEREPIEAEQEAPQSPTGGVVISSIQTDEDTTMLTDYSTLLYLIVILTLVNILLTLITIKRNRK